MKRALFILLLLSAMPPASIATVIVSIEPSSPMVNVGDMFAVNIVADISDPVLGWGLDLSFDTSILALIGSPVVDPSWSPGFAMDGDGLVGLAFPLSISGADISLAALTFEAIAIGTSNLIASITPIDLSEGFPLAFPAPPGTFDQQVTFNDGLIIVNSSPTTVPAPTTMVLLLVGFFTGLTVRKSKLNRGKYQGQIE